MRQESFRGLECIWIPHPQARKGSGHVLFLRGCLCHGEGSGYISQWLVFPSSLPELPEDLFGTFIMKYWWCWWDSWRVEEGKDISYSQANPHSVSTTLSTLPFKLYYQFMVVVDSVSDRYSLAVTFWVFLYLQTLGWYFALQPQFLDDFKKSCWFLVCLAFSYVRMGVTSFKLFTCRNWN